MLTKKLFTYSWITLIVLLCIIKTVSAGHHHHHDSDDESDSDHDSDSDDNEKHGKKEAKPVDLTEIVTPHNEEWLKEFDLTDIVGNVRPVGSGICKAPKCDGTDNDECFESCGNKATPEDIYGCPEGDNWALTFDDGPSNFTTDLLDILDEADIKVTFCVMGAHAKQYPEIVKRAYESGHQIASHTYSHAHLMSLTNEEIIYELRATEEVIKEIIGIRPRYIRPPYGEADARVKQIFKKLGYKALMWNVDPTDYNVHMLPDGAQQIQQMFDKIASGTPSNLNAHNDPGFISLQHDLYNTSIQQVPKIIESLKDKGFSFSTAAQCVGDKKPHGKGDRSEDSDSDSDSDDDYHEDKLKQNSAESSSEMKASQQEQYQMSSAGSLSSSFFVTFGLVIAGLANCLI